MKYIVIEIQKAQDGTVAIPSPTTHDTFFAAMARYHTVMAAAATSSVERYIRECVILRHQRRYA